MNISEVVKSVKINNMDLQKNQSNGLKVDDNSLQNYEEVDYNSQYYIPSFYYNSPDFDNDLALKNANKNIKKLLGYNQNVINQYKEQIEQKESNGSYEMLKENEILKLESNVLLLNGNKAVYENGTATGDIYSVFRSALTDDIQSLGDLKDYTPQGICNVRDYTLVSCYQEDDKPIIIIIDKFGNKKSVSLDIKKGTHVGGICYDPINNNIWVTGSNGEICLYDYSSIINNNGKDMVAPILTFDADVTNSDKSKIASYMTYFDGKIYVGAFNKDKSGTIKEYKVGSDGKTLEYEKKFTAPPQTQGISFIEKNGKQYMCASCSYGRNTDSHLKIFEYNNDDYNEIKDITLPPMLEQVTFNSDGTLKCVFESCANKYNDAKIKISNFCSLNLSQFIK